MSAPRRIPAGAIRVDLPNVVQRQDYTCGAACVLAVCAHFGVGETSEAALVARMGFGERGSDPVHLARAFTSYGLGVREHRGMTDATLRACLERGRPVVVMLQAWGARASYADHWTDGHWVVAIGFDRRGVYFEDPMIECVRGYLELGALAERWHDLEGDDDVRVERYGLEVWSRTRRTPLGRHARSLG